MEKFKFGKIRSGRINFLKENNKDHVLIEKDGCVLLSAPHGVSQVRLGKPKAREIGSLSTALCLSELANCSLIAKTRNNFDDANFDRDCAYRKTLIGFLKKGKTKYLIDFHGLASKRDVDINLGVNLENNVKTDIEAFERLKKNLESGGFKIVVDNPFMASGRTISGAMKNLFENLWTIQIEINCAITNKPENFAKYKTLLGILLKWINSLK